MKKATSFASRSASSSPAATQSTVRARPGPGASRSCTTRPRAAAVSPVTWAGRVAASSPRTLLRASERGGLWVGASGASMPGGSRETPPYLRQRRGGVDRPTRKPADTDEGASLIAGGGPITLREGRGLPRHQPRHHVSNRSKPFEKLAAL